MAVPKASYRNVNLLADAERWNELLDLAAAAGSVPVGERREVAHVVALEAPAPLAVAAVELFPEDDGFPGPLWEVVAHRPWRELAPHVSNPRVRDLIAHTRVLYGEDLRGIGDLESWRLGAPLHLESWESASWDAEWDIPKYDRTGNSGSTIWCCPPEAPNPVTLAPSKAERTGHAAVPVLDELSTAAQASAFRGTAWEAASMVAVGEEQCHAWQIPFSDAYPDFVHLAAGERAYEYRTGQAKGRIAVWAALSAMAGTTSSSDPRSVTAFVDRLRCVGWRGSAEPIWYFHLAMEDPDQGISWVLTGRDSD